MKLNLIFDFDGTLCDSLDESIIIANQFLSLIDKPHITAEQVKKRGMKQLLADYKVPKWLLPVFMLYYRWQVSYKIYKMSAYVGIPEAIRELSQTHKLGIVTSNSTGNVKKFLKKYKLDDCFDFIDSELSWLSKGEKVLTIIKHNKLNKSLSYYIGDETRDIDSMKKSKIKMIAVSWGIEDKKVLVSRKPFRIIDEPSQLVPLVERLQRQ
jgi:phosphoglycolate phosphatase